MRAAGLLTPLALVAVLAGCSTRSPSMPPRILATTTPPAATTSPSPAPTTASPTPDELSPKPGLETPPAAGQPTCKGSALTVTDADTLTDPRNAREVYTVRTTGADCQLSGYPSVTFQDSAGRSLPVTVQHSGFGVAAEAVQPVTLSRSTSISFEIGSARDGSCTDVAHVTVTLPGTTPGHRISTQLRICGNRVALSPVHRRGDPD